MKFKSCAQSIGVLLVPTALIFGVANGQQIRRASTASVLPAPTQLNIMRHEDERRWDDQLNALLADTNPQVRKRAALAAGRIGDERAVPVLAEMLLTDQDLDVRQMAAFALGEIESPGGAFALVTVLKDPAKPERARAIEALGKVTAALQSRIAAISDAAAKHADDDRLDLCQAAIVDALRSENGRGPQRDRLTVLLGLTAVLRTKPDGVGPLVAKFLDDPDPTIVATALNTMARLRLKDGNERVRQLLSDGDPIVRANAARVIGAADHKEAFEKVLELALHDIDLRVRVSAIRTLASLKDARAVEPLLDRARGLTQSAAADRIGVAECDDFIARYDACVSNKVPESARSQFRATLAQWRSSWKKLAQDPNTKPALASACKQALEQQEPVLKMYGCTVAQNELLEIATTLGRLLPNTSNDAAIAWIREMHYSTKGEAVEVEIAFARMAPGIFSGEAYKSEAASRNAAWRQVSRRAQGLAAIRDVITGPAADSAGDHVLKDAQKELAQMLQRSTTPTLAIPDVLQAYNSYKIPDAAEFARKYLLANDVVVRATAAEVIGSQPPSEQNTRTLIEALPRAMRDKDLNDAALAILNALGKQKTATANDAIKTGLNSSDHLIRRRAVALLKANGAGDFSDRIGTVQTRNTPVDYRRAMARAGKHVTATVVTSSGAFTIEFLPTDAPLTVDNFVQLARKGYFNGQVIPRVVPNFVVQAGDPRGDQNGGPGYQIRCEINEALFERAAVGMALSGKDTGGSQWFVTHSPQPHLDGGYTVFGHVIRGMDVIDKIVRGDVIRRVIVNER